MSLKVLAAAILDCNGTRNSRATVNDPLRNSHAIDATSELRNLVTRCGRVYGFSQEELADATQLALHDPATSLPCFRAIARELGIT